MEIHELDQHCLLLSGFYEQVKLYNVYQWLNLAAGIISVDFETVRFDDSIGMCGTAYDYAEEESSFNKKVVTELTRFSFVWSALESLIEIVQNDKSKNKKDEYKFLYKGRSYSGKINYICFYLFEEFEGLGHILYYNQLLDHFLYLLSSNSLYKELLDDYQMKGFYGKSGIGISIVYKIRNRFAHGSLKISNFEDVYEGSASDEELIRVSTRIVLLTIQMITISYLKGKGTQYNYWDESAGVMHKKDACQFLWSAHKKMI